MMLKVKNVGEIVTNMKGDDLWEIMHIGNLSKKKRKGVICKD